MTLFWMSIFMSVFERKTKPLLRSKKFVNTFQFTFLHYFYFILKKIIYFEPHSLNKQINLKPYG
jgi:hypothetical protein